MVTGLCVLYGIFVHTTMLRTLLQYGLLITALLCSLPAEGQRMSKPSTTYTIRDGLVQQQVRCFLEDANGYIWIGTMAGLSRFDGHTIQSFGFQDGFTGSQIYSMLKDRDGTLWYNSAEKVMRFNGIKEEVVTDSSAAFWQRQSPEIWALLTAAQIGQKLGGYFPELKGLGKKVVNISLRTQATVVVDFEKRQVYHLSDRCITQKLPDWFPATVDEVKGLQYIVGDHQYFTWVGNKMVCAARFIPGPDTVQVLCPQAPTIFNFKTQYWYREGDRYVPINPGNFNRIDYIYLASNRRLFIATDQGFAVQFIDGPELISVPEARYPWSILPDNLRNIWIGSHHDGIIQLDKDLKNARVFPVPPNNFTKHQIFPGKLTGPDGTILFGGYKGIYYLKEGRLRFIEIKESIEALTWDAQQQQYLAGGSKIYQINQTLSPNSTAVPLFDLEGKTANDIKVAPDHKIWVATGEGIYCYDRNHAKLYMYRNVGNCKSLYIDQAGRIWAGCNNGLRLLDTQTNNFNAVNQIHKGINSLTSINNDHLAVITDMDVTVLHITPSNTPEISSYWSDQNGYSLLESSENGASFDGNYLWIPAGNGIQRISASGLLNKTSPLKKLVLEKIESRPVAINDSIRKFDVYQNTFSAKFSAINFQDRPTKIEYSINSGARQTAEGFPNIQFTGLYHGENDIRVWVMEGKDTISVPVFTVNAAYKYIDQATIWWLLMILLLLIIFAIIGWRYESNKKQRKLNQVQLSAVQAQLNPHIFFNMLSSLQNSIANRSTDEATAHLVQIARFTREILEFSMPADGKSPFPFLTIPLTQEMGFLDKYLKLESIQHSTPFSYDIINHISSPENIVIPPLLVQPLVENAVLHGLRPLKNASGRITITFKDDGPMLYITVTDNGKGVTNKHKNHLFLYRSRGGELQGKRIDLIKQLGYFANLSIQPNPEGGTIAEIRIKKMICV
jgi:streptogramin lyase